MERHCNCPDYGDPCKHMAALYYVIAREIDNDPHTLFRLRGLDLVTPFGAQIQRSIAPPFAVTLSSGNDGESESPVYDSENDTSAIFIDIPHCAGLISSLLPGNPPFSDRDFAVVMAEFYHHGARYTPWARAGEPDAAAREHDYSRSRWTVEGDAKPGGKLVLVRENIQGNKTTCAIDEAFLLFREFAADDGTQSYGYLFYLFKFLNILAAAGAFIPAPLVEEKRLSMVWQPFTALQEINAALNEISRYEDKLFAVPEEKPKRGGKARFVSSRSVTDLIAAATLSGYVRGMRFAPSGGDYPFRELCGLFFAGAALDVSSPAARSIPLAVDRWLAVLHTDFGAFQYRFTVKAASAKNEDAPPEFNLSLDVLLADTADAASPLVAVPLQDAARKTGSIEVLRAPTALSNYLPEINALSTKKQVRLTETRLAAFLDDAAGILERLGIIVAFPKNLHRELKPRLVVEGAAKKAGSLVSYLDMDSLLDFQWKVAIGGAVLTAAEFQKLVKAKTSVVRFRDRFIRLDPAELSALLNQAQRAQNPSAQDFLKAYFSGDTVLSFDAEAMLHSLFEERQFPAPSALRASLRQYQERGYNWVCSLLLSGFGCILADDMGLGKTVQAISVLLRLGENDLLGDQTLVIAPAALLDNWERELSRFAPGLMVSRYHGARRAFDAESAVFLTTYQTAVRDAEKLAGRQFSLLIVDEAHLMKNAETRGAKTVKHLNARYRLALSGTPVENRLEDMRSLFDFVLPGYLGTKTEFKDTFRTPIEVMRNRTAAERLKKITAPFLLRRLKTDKTIIQDLPDKITSNHYAALEKEQAALYESIVSETLKKSEALEDPAARPSLVLGLLTALKQVCDHPRVYDKESPAVSGLSGKALLLVTLLEEILANREKTLIFSQYVETLSCLEMIIARELGEKALLYHGGLPQKKRGEVIDRFQADSSARILLVSLRAGGLGLNLTAASRIIHYDLWYNPAVENQATDRAFRIGQTRNVFVHRFITKNSFEEKIDAMLTDKRELADLTVSSGEAWLSRMSHAELAALFAR
jgi:superfamily II DNA or RNA helicase